jgi:hypothetical protein
VASKGRINRELEKVCKGVIMPYFKLLFQQLSGRHEEEREIVSIVDSYIRTWDLPSMQQQRQSARLPYVISISKLVEEMTLRICLREVPGSNLSPDTVCSD